MLIADFVLMLHVMVVVFNVGGLLAILIGAALGWSWVRNRLFRITHVAMMSFVTVETILGASCPLTVLEDWLRGVAGQQSFMQRWAGSLIYWHAPPWVFTILYLLVTLLIVIAWKIVPPRPSTAEVPPA